MAKKDPDANVVDERLKLVHERLGHSDIDIEIRRPGACVSEIRVYVKWRYTLIMDTGSMRRYETMAERTSAGHSLFTALGNVLMDIDSLEANLKQGLVLGDDRTKRDPHY